MANLSETPIWEDNIRQLETTDDALGGSSGVMNTQAKQLANRTSWLKTVYQSLNDTFASFSTWVGNQITTINLTLTSHTNSLNNKVNTNDSRLADAREIKAIGGTVLHTKIVNIGDWNMDATTTMSINPGIDTSKIRSIDVIIRRDTDTDSSPDRWSFLDDGYFNIPNTSFFTLSRPLGGKFDAFSFSSTSFNRGWVIIGYID